MSVRAHKVAEQARVVLVAFLLGGLAVTAFGYGIATATGWAGSATPTVVTVTAGRPGEFAFKLSTAKILSGTVVFKVTNRGKLSHAFEVCTAPSAGAATTGCSGVRTKTLWPGHTGTVTVSFARCGTYGFLSPLPGQAANGMKGSVTVRLSSPSKPATTRSSTPTPVKPAPTPAPTITSPGTLGSDAADGKAIFESQGCTSCHTIAEVQAAFGGTVNPGLNSTHTRGPFLNGALTAAQIADIASFVRGA